MSDRPTFTASIDTKALIELLSAISIGTTVTYEQMQDKIGRNPQNGGRGSVQSARKALERDGVVFAAVKNVGLLRLDDVGVVRTAESDVSSIRRKANRGFKRVTLGVQNYTAMKPEDRMKFNATASILGMLSTSLKPQRLRRIEDRVKGESGVLPLMKTLEAFKD